jgi:hypothetical protein
LLRIVTKNEAYVTFIFIVYHMWTGIVDIATSRGLNGQGIKSQWWEIFRNRRY